MEERKDPVALGIEDYLNELLAELYIELLNYEIRN
jgi:hypothetical protein